MSQFSSDKPQVFIPPAFEDFRGYLSVPYDRDVPFQVCQINQRGIYAAGTAFSDGGVCTGKNGFLPAWFDF
jgi:hypothetical protein